MFQVLNIDSYGPVLKMLGERETTESALIFWLVIFVASMPLLLYVAYRVRRWLRRRDSIARSFGTLEKLADQKNLNYLEQVTVENLARAANLQNPAQLITSVAVFDQAVAAWMPQVRQMPWLEMEEQVERLASLRKTLGFRYLPSDRPPGSTRELVLGQHLYLLAGGSRGLRLLSTSVVDLDDLAIRAAPFEADGRPVTIKKHQDIWVFFWTETGGEYRFKTRVLKFVEHPAPFLMLQHGDTLVSDDGRKTFSCDMEHEMVADLLPVSEYGRGNPSPALFERYEERLKTISINLLELSGSGFVTSSGQDLEVNDLIWIKGGSDLPAVLEGKLARAVRTNSHHAHFKFLKLPSADLDAILHYITPRISPAEFMKKTGETSLTRD